MPLFIDQLDIWLMTLGITLITAAYGVFVNFVRRPTRIATDGSSTTTAQMERPVTVCLNVNKCLSLFFITVGIYALATGLWASMTWPLPGPYNLMFSDAWPIFGLVSLMLGLAMYLGVDLRYLSLPIALFSIPVIVYGVDILMHGLTTEPLFASGMYILLGLAMLISPGAMLPRGNASRYVGAIVMILLILSGVLAFFIGISATFQHTLIWMKWAPWYGTSS
jgi:putative membrane protein